MRSKATALSVHLGSWSVCFPDAQGQSVHPRSPSLHARSICHCQEQSHCPLWSCSLKGWGDSRAHQLLPHPLLTNVTLWDTMTFLWENLACPPPPDFLLCHPRPSQESPMAVSSPWDRSRGTKPTPCWGQGQDLPVSPPGDHPVSSLGSG